MRDIVSIAKGNTKLGKVYNISLPPGLSCQPNVPCAKTCYARKAWRQYPKTREAWTRNWRIWNTDNLDYMEQVAAFCATHHVERFRWHVAGDIPDRTYYLGMCTVANCNPETQFLAFTKNFNVIKWDRPSNLRIVASMWPGLESKFDINVLRSWVPIAWVHLNEENQTYTSIRETYGADAMACHGHCDECFMCWYLEPSMSVVMEEH